MGLAELPRTRDPEAVRAILAVLAIVHGARVHGRVLVEFSEDEVLELEKAALGEATRTPANPPLQRTDASVAPLPRASAAERQGRWADTMNNVYFACEGCRMMVNAGYRWAYWELEHHGVVQRRKAVSVEAVLAAVAYWAPDAEPPSKWLTDEVLPAVRLFLDVHSSRQLTYGDVEEIVGTDPAALFDWLDFSHLPDLTPRYFVEVLRLDFVGQSARVGEDARSTAMVVGRSGTHGTRQGEISRTLWPLPNQALQRTIGSLALLGRLLAAECQDVSRTKRQTAHMPTTLPDYEDVAERLDSLAGQARREGVPRCTRATCSAR